MAAARVLLLGGSGLLGAPAARALRDAGHEVTVVSRGRRVPLDGVRQVAADRADGGALAAALRGERFGLAVDFLAYRGEDVDRVLSLPDTRIERYVLVSSGQVYLVAAERRPPSREADGALPLMPEPAPGTRDHREWLYGVGKREAEASLGRRAASRAGADLVLRLPVVQGANDATRRLWAYLERMLDGGPLLLPEGGTHPVRFVWAEDVARTLASLASLPSSAPRPSGVYNLAQPDEPALRELLARAAECLGVPARFVGCTESQLASAGLDHGLSPFSGAWCSRPDPSRAVAELGFRGTSSRDWLPEVVRAHRAEASPVSHPGYAARARERDLAERIRKS
jgi:nucleoside-diphosphate-sugar epimerase